MRVWFPSSPTINVYTNVYAVANPLLLLSIRHQRIDWDAAEDLRVYPLVPDLAVD